MRIDEWTKTIADGLPTTTRAYRDQSWDQSPLAEPPQGLLIVVAADLSKRNRTADVLEHTLTENLTLAKFQVVGQDAVGRTGKLRPALYLANNGAERRCPYPE